MSSSILVEEIGLDIMVAAAVAAEEPPADIEMQQRMDEDEGSSRSNGDCDMVEDAALAEATEIVIDAVEEPMQTNPVVEQILAEQLVAAEAVQLLDTSANHPAEIQLDLQPAAMEPPPIVSPSLSQYVVSPELPTSHPLQPPAPAAEAPEPFATLRETSPAPQQSSAPVTDHPDADFATNQLIELARQSWGTHQPNYLRGCLWSPDGTCLLTPVNRDGMHVMELPADLYTADTCSPRRPLDLLTSAVHVPEAGTVYDYCWYPYMSSAEPATCCWLSTQQHGPIQMWDAFDGKLRCSYRGYDAVDELEAAVSVCFSSDAQSVIGGYRKSVKIFRTALPGRESVQFALKTPASALAVHAQQPDLLAVGAWTGAVTVHDTRSPRLEVTERLARRRAGGVTMMRFVEGGRRLWVGSRKDGVLACWDVRMPVEPVLQLRREVRTNQRVQFDVSAGGRWLVSGDTGGVVRAWDLEASVTEAEDAEAGGGGLREWQFGVHHDCCNGVALHPQRPVMATSSGQHHFGRDVEEAAEEEEGEGERGEVKRENSLILWWYGRTGGDEEEEEDEGVEE